MNTMKNRIKSFFIEKEPKQKLTEKDKGLYVLKLKDEFKQQFPLTLNSYVQVDTLKPNNYSLTDKIYSGVVFGHKVLLSLEEANNLKEELYTIPLEIVLVTKESVVNENV